MAKGLGLAILSGLLGGLGGGPLPRRARHQSPLGRLSGFELELDDDLADEDDLGADEHATTRRLDADMRRWQRQLAADRARMMANQQSAHAPQGDMAQLFKALGMKRPGGYDGE
jgi:hypothetical protein